MYLSSQKRNVKNCVLISRKYILRKCFIRNYVRLIFNDKNFRENIRTGRPQIRRTKGVKNFGNLMKLGISVSLETRANEYRAS